MQHNDYPGSKFIMFPSLYYELIVKVAL